MARPKGSSGIKPELRQQWLERHNNGESIFSIATKDGYDQRTVKVHIQTAQSEQTFKQERGIVLRGALEQHYNDLLNRVETALSMINTDKTVVFYGDDEFLWSALQNHMPNSRIWPLIKEWNATIADITKSKDALKKDIDEALSGSALLASTNDLNNGILFRGATALLLYNIEELCKGNEGLHIEHDAKEEKRENGKRDVSYGAFHLGEIEDSEANNTIKELWFIEQKIMKWDQVSVLKKLYRKLSTTGTKLKEELKVIKWRRVIPGKCRLCPV